MPRPGSRSGKREWSSTSSSENESERTPRARKRKKGDPELGHFSRLSLSTHDSPTSKRRDSHITWINSLSDSEQDGNDEEMDRDPVEGSEEQLQLQFPKLLAEKLAQIGKEELVPISRPEMSLVLYRVSPSVVSNRSPDDICKPLLPPAASTPELDRQPDEELSLNHAAPPSSPVQEATPLADEMSAMDIDSI